MSREVVVAALLLCVGCGSGGNETPPPLHGNVSVGLPVEGAAVTAYDSNGNVIAGPLPTDAYGNVTFPISAQSSGIVISTSQGTVTLAGTPVQTPVMSVLLPAGASEFAITPITGAANARSAFAAGREATFDQLEVDVTTAVAGLAQQFGLQDVRGTIPADATQVPRS